MSDLTIPLKGGWVLVTKMPPTRTRPRLFGLYYAKPERVFERGESWIGNVVRRRLDKKLLLALYRERQNAQLSEDEQSTLDRGRMDLRLDEEDLDDIELELRVRILTEDGEVCLEPHEYSIVQDIQPYLDEIGQGMILHELGGVKNAKKLKEQLFYVMSRGIPKVEAYRMLLGQIDRWNVFWLETHPDVVAYFQR